MFDEALRFLFYRKDYKDLLNRIQVNYDKEKKAVNEMLKALTAGSFSNKSTQNTPN